VIAPVTVPRQTRIDELIVARAGQIADAVALVFRDRSWTYGELLAQSTALAGRLREAGVVPGDLVAISVPRSLEMVAALLAVLRSGCAYLPIDPRLPPARRAWMIDDARPAAVISAGLDADAIVGGSSPALKVERGSGDDHARGELAYVLYTSGSTGLPKGVAVTHANLAHFVAAMDGLLGREPGVWLSVTSLGFDISVLELLWTLARGYQVVVLEDAQVAPPSRSPFSLAAQIRRHAVTHLQCTPALASIIVRERESLAALGGLRALLVGGESLPMDLARLLTAAIPGDVYNVYGPTETTIWSTAHRLSPDDAAVYIGRPIGETRTYVLDAAGARVPAGAEGELYIGGPGVAAGYLRQPALTTERFVADPFAGGAGDRMYRTGDLVREHAAHGLEFLGRLDRQVKFRGVRIEPGEIECQLREHPAVLDAVVEPDRVAGDVVQLLGYVVADPAHAPDGALLRAWLADRLPESMVPASIVTLPAIPLTPNGKIDRAALARTSAPVEVAAYLRATGGAAAADADPATVATIEGELCRLWSSYLGGETIEPESDFFDVGGHSVIAVRMFAELRDRYGVDLGLSTLFEARTPAALAVVVHAGIRRRSGPTVAVADSDPAAGVRATVSAPDAGRLVPIQPRGDRPPVYLIHAISGTVMVYHELVRHLPADQPVYGVEARGLQGFPADHRIEEMAARYIEQIRRLQPDGPYHLVGHSFGGLVAYEMCCQLETAGVPTGLIGLIDTRLEGMQDLGIEAGLAPHISVADRMRRHLHALVAGPERLNYLLGRGTHFQRRMARMAYRALNRALHPIGLELPETLRNVEQANWVAVRTWAPRRTRRRITYFRCSIRNEWDSPDYLAGWGKVVEGAVEVREVAGDHLSILTEPDVGGLAAHLASCLDAYTPRPGPGAEVSLLPGR